MRERHGTQATQANRTERPQTANRHDARTSHARGRGETDCPGRNAEAKADTYENRTGYANDGGWGKQRQKRNDGHIATDETRNSPAVFKQPTAYQDDMTMRCGRARRGGIKSKQHTRRRERSGMITHHADMKTPSHAASTDRSTLPAHRIGRTGRKAMRRWPPGYGMTTRRNKHERTDDDGKDGLAMRAITTRRTRQRGTTAR